MARVTVEDCLDLVDNRFDLVILAGKRAKQLLYGASSKLNRDSDKSTVLALREIAAHLITEDNVESQLIQEKEELSMIFPDIKG